MAASRLLSLAGAFALLCTIGVGRALGDIEDVYRGGASTRCGPVLQAGALGEGVVLYCDRTHVWTAVPAPLVGTTFVQVSNSDRSQADLTYELTVMGEGHLLLFIDNRVGNDDGGIDDLSPLLGADPLPMGWVLDQGFADTGADIGIDENADGDINQTYSIFALAIGAGQQIVNLGGQIDGDSRNNYLIGFATAEQFAALEPSVAPVGWIPSRQWNFLFPLGNPGNCDPGPAMSANWVAPHDLGAEDPESGDVWDDIDFAGTARASNWGAPSFGPPVWYTLDLIETSYNTGAGALPTRQLVNYEELAQRINTLLGGNPGFVPLLEDNVLGIATTYVENTGATPLVVDICTASDDSIQVLVNDTAVTNVHACRGSSGGCQELSPAVLPTGVSKITTLVWQGGGGHNFRLAIHVDGELVIDANAADFGLVFHGPVPPEGTGTQANYAVARQVAQADPNGCDGTTVTLAGNGAGDAADPATVIETVLPSNVDAIEISDITPAPASVEDVRKASGMTVDGFIREWLLIGPFTSPVTNTDAPGDATIRADWLRNADGTITEANVMPRAGDTVATDFGASATATGVAGPDDLHPGGLPTWNAWSDGDDTINLEDYYRGGIDQIVVVGVAYFCLEQDTELVVALASDDSIQCLVDGAEKVIVNSGRGYGGANEVQNRASLGVVPAGKHMIMVKVFEGGGGHGFRLRLEEADGAPFIDPDRVRLSLGPGDDPCGGEEVAGSTITWDVTKGDLDAGLSYVMTTDSMVSTTHRGAAPGTAPRIDGGATAFLQAVTVGPAVGAFEGSYDSGSVAVAGSIADNGDGSYTISGSGSDIWDGGDHMHFAFTEVTGDFTATMRAVDVQNPPNSRFGRLGIMARATCHQSSKYSLACVPYRGEDPANNDTRRHQSRRDHLTNGNTRDHQVLSAEASATMDPVLGWVRLTRSGNQLFSEFAADVDGTPGRWYLAGGDTWPAGTIGDTLLVGPVASAHGSAGENPLVYTFDNWSVGEFSLPETPCSVTAPVLSLDFDDDPPLDLATDPRFEVAGSTFTPAVVNGRLRITSDATTDTVAQVFIDPGAGNALGDVGFELALDAYYGGSGESADGMNFVVLPRVDVDTGQAGFPIHRPFGGGGGDINWRRLDHNQIPAGRILSFGVELDPWDGGNWANDPPGGYGANAGPDDGYHVGINQSEETQSSQTNVEFGAALPFVFDDRNDGNGVFDNKDPLRVTITYEPLTESVARVQVRVDHTTLADGPRLVLDSFVARLDGDIVVGVTGATGGATADQEVDNITLSARCCEVPDEVTIDGATESTEPDVTLTATVTGADGPVTYDWVVVADETGGASIVDNGDGTATVTAADSGSVTVRVTVGDGACADASAEHTVVYTLGIAFYRMDDNNDGDVNIADAQWSLNYQFLGGPAPVCMAAADANGDGDVNIADPQWSLNYQFLGGPAPPAPFVAPPNCERTLDPGAIALGCEQSSCSP